MSTTPAKQFFIPITDEQAKTIKNTGALYVDGDQELLGAKRLLVIAETMDKDLLTMLSTFVENYTKRAASKSKIDYIKRQNDRNAPPVVTIPDGPVIKGTSKTEAMEKYIAEQNKKK